MPGADPSGLHVQRALHLKTFPAFAQLPLETLSVLADPCEDLRFDEGQVVLSKGHPAEALHFILEGEVEVRKGHEILRRMHAREAVGGLAVLTGSAVDAVAAAPTHTLALAREALFEVFEDHPDIRTAVIRALARTLLNHLRKGADRAHTELPFGGASRPDLRDLPFEASDGLALENLLALFGAFSFAGVTVSATADLAREVRPVELRPRARLWSRGDPANDVWIPMAGALAARTEAGEQLRVTPGAVLGALDAIAGLPRWTSAEAAETTRALVLTADAILDTAEDHPSFAFGLIRALARAIQRRSRGKHAR